MHECNETTTTSQRQGRFREGSSEGSPCANLRADEQKPHTRPSLWASWHDTAKPFGSGGRVNEAVVQGSFTFLSGEICLTRDSALAPAQRKHRPWQHGAGEAEVSRRHRSGVSGKAREALQRRKVEATDRPSRNDAPRRPELEGPAIELRRASRDVEPARGSRQGPSTQARTGAMNGVILFTLPEPPDADPHVRWCGEGEGKPPPYPIRH